MSTLDPLAAPVGTPPVTAPPLRHSGLGIASFVMAVVMTCVMVVLFAFAGYLEMSTPGGVDEDSAGAITVGLALMASWVLILVSLALGIAGLFVGQRKRVFAILGVVIGGGILLLSIGLMLLGLAMG